MHIANKPLRNKEAVKVDKWMMHIVNNPQMIHRANKP